MPTERQPVHRRTVILSTIVAVLTIGTSSLPVVRYLVTPWLVGAVEDAISAQTDEKVTQQTAPTREGLRALLQDKIDELATKVAVLQAQQAREPSKFTAADATELASAVSRLKKQEAALTKIDAPPKPTP